MPDAPDPGEHRWFKLEPGRLDVGIIAEGGSPGEHAARFLDALGPEPDVGEVHLDVTVYSPDGYHQPGCASGTWLTGTLVGRIADGLGMPPILFASEPLNHWAHLGDAQSLAITYTPTSPALPRITDAFTCQPDCPRCGGDGAVCEDHPDVPFGDCCGAAGMPCNPDLRGGPRCPPSTPSTPTPS